MSLTLARTAEILGAYGCNKPQTIGQWFWRRVERGHPMDCWPWQGYRQPNGYGSLHWEPGSKKSEYAHRVAWLISGRSLVPGLVVMHVCDNPPCCNPAHLRQDTYSANTQDAIIKGRYYQHLQTQTHCKYGHLLMRTRKTSHCPECEKRRSAEWYQRKNRR